MQIVAFANLIDLMLFRIRALNSSRRINNLQLWEFMIALTYHVAPSFLLVNLVNNKNLAASFDEFFSKFHQAASLKIKTRHVDVKTSLKLGIEVQLDVLQQKSSFTHTTRSFDSNKPVTPVDFIHQSSGNTSVGMLN